MTHYDRGRRDGMQIACTMLISIRAQAEADALDAERKGYPTAAIEMRQRARVASDVEGRLRVKMEHGT